MKYFCINKSNLSQFTGKYIQVNLYIVMYSIGLI